MMKLKIDPFMALMMGAVLLATILPAQGVGATVFQWISTIGVAFLFFAHGAALSRSALLGGAKQWQLHLFILATTFIVFPLVIYPLGLLPRSWLPEDLFLGFLYLAALPSAVSSSIAFTAMARGNVPAAICASAGSNVFGLMLTPLLVAVLMKTSAGGAIDLSQSLQEIVLELLLPFALGQLIHPKVADFMARRKQWLNNYDQSVIIIIIYTAFSQSVIEGLWSKLPPASLVVAIVLCTLLLLVIFAFTMYAARGLGFSRGDEIAAVFCGSKKSLASGLPLAQVLFAGAPGFGMIVLPIMLYNQIQILMGAVLARRYARHGEEESIAAGEPLSASQS